MQHSNRYVYLKLINIIHAYFNVWSSNKNCISQQLNGPNVNLAKIQRISSEWFFFTIILKLNIQAIKFEIKSDSSIKIYCLQIFIHFFQFDKIKQWILLINDSIELVIWVIQRLVHIFICSSIMCLWSFR